MIHLRDWKLTNSHIQHEPDHKYCETGYRRCVIRKREKERERTRRMGGLDRVKNCFRPPDYGEDKRDRYIGDRPI